jgi:fucose 4-O-acetylase-like acetyltransferase
MKVLPHKSERIHSLDSLRAIMMMLGLVFHSALTYGVSDLGEGWPIKDPGATNLSNDLLKHLISRFRMPLFFLVAGFFGALLFYDRTPIKMLKNRIQRLLLPLIVFFILLWPVIIFSFSYTQLTFSGSHDAFRGAMDQFSDLDIVKLDKTYHLWFLYYLTLITTASFLLALVFKKLPNISKLISKSFNWVIQKPVVRVLVFTGLTSLVYLIMGTTSTSGMSLIPSLGTFIFFFYFYGIGWILFKSKRLLDHIMRLDWACVSLGVALTLFYLFNLATLKDGYIILLKSLTVWLFIFGITGLFIRYGSNHSSKMRYVSDAAYWVYLIHFPLTIFIPSLLFKWNVPATIKFLTVLLVTTFICFITYHYFVRTTFIGKFLNGKKYSRKLSDIKKK